MSFNYKQSKGEKYPIQINGKTLKLTEEQIGELIKNRLKNNKVIMNVFDDFGVSLDSLDQLHIQITNLNDRYAETDEHTMSLDSGLFEDGGRFFEEKFFIVAHEIIHFLTRKRESRAYFADNEEREGFVLSIAYELSVGTPMNILYNRIFPKIGFHFHDPNDAEYFFHDLCRKAKNMLKQ